MIEIRPRLLGSCSIEVGEVEVTPAASHLFALLLAFALAPREPWTRRRLQELLFAGADDSQAGHRLRQLLYRLRGFGVVLQESSTGVIRLGNPVADPLAGDPFAPDDAAPPPLPDPLALYTPRMPAPFLDWLEHRRDTLRGQLATRRLALLRAARERQEWSACVRLAATLHDEDPAGEEVASILAEAHAMLGRRDAALAIIDRLVRERGGDVEAYPALRRLRARVLSTRVPRREGTMRGREECLAFLADQWARATGEPGGRACAIFGPAGMGKTRVGESFAGTIRLAGGQVIQHRADEHARAFPLALFSELVPDLRRRRGSIGADPALSRVLDDIAPHVVPSAEGIAPPAERREAMRRAIIDLLEAVSAEQPMLIVIDDAHLLDDASRAVIRSLADSPNTAQVLVVLLCRPRPDGHSLLSASHRFASYVLPPLSDADSRALLLELAGEARPTDEEVEWAVHQAEGNAFYLNALAQHRGGRVSLPAHIRSLAQTSYLGLSMDARTVLDASLMLDTLASPARVERVAALAERELLAALRELEDTDLLRCEEGVFVGPHAILREALDDLVPSTARAVLHRRVAVLIAAECEDPAQARVVAWTAVRSWLAAGDPKAAVALALQVARHAAAVGEPGVGAELLEQIPRTALPLERRRELLNALIALAEASKNQALLSSALAERTQVAEQSAEGHAAIARYKLHSISTHQFQVRRTDTDDVELMIGDVNLPIELRIDAVIRLLVNADLSYGREQAEDAYQKLSTLPHSGCDGSTLLRANLIYHTTFGDPTHALGIADSLLAQFRVPSLERDNRRSIAHAALALNRLGLYERSVDVSMARLHSVLDSGHRMAIESFGGLAVEGLINLGEYEKARAVFRTVETAVGKQSPGDLTVGSGVPLAGIALALKDSDFERADAMIATLSAKETASFPRLRSILIAQQMLSLAYRGQATAGNGGMSELYQLYERGKAFGAQDSAAEAIWLDRISAGESRAASRHLKHYLQVRRELGPPEASLRTVTAADEAWK